MSVFDLFKLTGKNAIVTGSSRGIGRAIAFSLAEAGANVVVHGSRESAALDKTIVELQEFAPGVKITKLVANLLEENSVEEMLTADALKNIDILVLNASYQIYEPVEMFQWDEFQKHFQANVAASFRLVQALLPHMREQHWGRVLALGSVNQWRQSPNLPIYAATKSALSNLIQNCARKYGPDGVTFNTLAPGVIATDRNREALANQETVDLLLRNIPAKRFGTAEDCASLALLLCSEAGSYITGADIPVAGGMQL